MQPAGVPLATLHFHALAVGTSPLAFARIIVDDAEAVRLDVDATGGSVTVSPAQVPAAAWLLLGVGRAACALRRRHRRIAHR